MHALTNPATTCLKAAKAICDACEFVGLVKGIIDMYELNVPMVEIIKDVRSGGMPEDEKQAYRLLINRGYEVERPYTYTRFSLREAKNLVDYTVGAYYLMLKNREAFDNLVQQVSE